VLLCASLLVGVITNIPTALVTPTTNYWAVSLRTEKYARRYILTICSQSIFVTCVLGGACTSVAYNVLAIALVASVPPSAKSLAGKSAQEADGHPTSSFHYRRTREYGIPDRSSHRSRGMQHRSKLAVEWLARRRDGHVRSCKDSDGGLMDGNGFRRTEFPVGSDVYQAIDICCCWSSSTLGRMAGHELYHKYACDRHLYSDQRLYKSERIKR
jgi:hypothetical protein